MCKLYVILLGMLLYWVSGVFAYASAQSQSVHLIQTIEARTARLDDEVRALRTELAELKKTAADKKQKVSVVAMGFVPIVASPYLIGSNINGIQLDPSGLIVSLPAYNQDWGLLKQRQDLKLFSSQATQSGLVQVSGMVETQVTGTHNSKGSSVSDIDLSEAELHVSTDINPWVMGFISIAYDNTQLPNTITRLHNSSLFLDRAFITIGNLGKAPVYFTAGQRFVAFGHYDNYMATAPLTRLLGRVRARQISVSYQYPGDTGLYATAFAFKGDIQMVPSSQHINQAGGSLGYIFKNQYLKVDLGVDYINNLADSEGMVALAFNQNAFLVKRAPGVAVHAKLAVGAYTLIAEYIGATTAFDVRNLGFNRQGARPQALDTVLVYSFNSWNKPSDFSIGYAQTREALALFMPERRFAMNYNLVILKDMILSLEYYRDYKYSATSTATAQGVLRGSTGGFSDTVTGMLTYYF